MPHRGFITLHRKLTDWEWYKDVPVKTLFLHIVLNANHKPKKWKGILINRGEILVGRFDLAKDTGLTIQQVRTAKKKLKSTNEITIKATNKYSIISLVNYSLYQEEKKKSNQQPNQQPNQQVTNNQPTSNHNQQCKQLNNENKKEEIKNKEIGEEKGKINIAFAECLQVIEIAKSFSEHSPAYVFENKTTNAVVLGMGGIKEISKTIADKSDLGYWKHDFEKTWKICKQMGKTSNKASGNLKKKSGRFKLIREKDPAYGKEEILIDNDIETVPEVEI